MKKYYGVFIFAIAIIGLFVIVNKQLDTESRLIEQNTPTSVGYEVNSDDPNAGSTDMVNAEAVNPGYEYTFPEEKYPYRVLLTFEERNLYNQIYANAVKYNTTFKSVATVNKDRLNNVMEALTSDHPELFWLKNQFQFTYEYRTNNVIAMKLNFYEFDDINHAKTQFDIAVNEIVREANKLSTDIEKEKYICDKVSSMSTTKKNAQYDQSAYSALVLGKTVCAGHARAVQICMQEAGLTAYYIHGTANNGYHAWNMVKLDDDYYNLDSYWNDCISEDYGSQVYPYFNLDDDKMNVDHLRSGLSMLLPDANGKSMIYSSKFGSTVSVDDVRQYWEQAD